MGDLKRCNVLRVAVGDRSEPAPSVDRVTHPVVEVREHVPLAQVMVANPLGALRRRLHQLDRCTQVATVRQRTCRHDPSLGEDLVWR